LTGEVESKRVVIATIGSLGDLHPCLALPLELGRRGHRVTIASTEYYRDKVEELGIGFHAIRPNWNPTDRELIGKCEDLKSGPEIRYRKLILPELKGTYDDLLSVAASADLMIAGELVYAAPLVAEKLRLRWVSAILSPFSFFSSHDPSVMVTVPGLMRLRKAGWPVYRAGLTVCRLATRHWSNPVRHLRRELRLHTDCDPVFRDKFSPDLVLALFSHYLAQPQPDWPPQTLQPGFVYYDRQKAEAEPCAELAAFLRSGDKPVVFTLGSTAVNNPGNFYEANVEATKQLGRRAVLLGTKAASGLSEQQFLALPYAPYSQIFPHAAAIVHQGRRYGQGGRR
jgi:rhamnosyltransferase subunit B